LGDHTQILHASGERDDLANPNALPEVLEGLANLLEWV
jgi:hypothetical protein